MIFGVSSILIFCTFRCRVDDNSSLAADFVYKNETDYFISYNYMTLDSSDTTELFVIDPHSEKVLEIISEATDKRPSIERCCQGLLHGIQRMWLPILVIFNDTKCILYIVGEGPTTSNFPDAYEAEQLSRVSFRYTYVFREEDYQKAELCK